MDLSPTPAPAGGIAGRVRERRARVHAAGQRISAEIIETLNRWPNREEWQELMLLFAWFGLILMSDALSVQAVTIGQQSAVLGWQLQGATLPTPPVSDQMVLWSAWFIQALARAGFFTIFAYSLHRAWQLGWGVLIARILQLKLIHTVLVVIAGLSIGHLLEKASWGGHEPYYYYSDAPWWLTTPVICGLVILLSLQTAYLRQSRFWTLGFFLIAVFLWPGGPVTSRTTEIKKPIVQGSLVELSTGELVEERHYNPGREAWKGQKVIATHEPDPYILQRYVTQQRYLSSVPVDVHNNTWSIFEEHPSDLFFHIKNWRRDTKDWTGDSEWQKRLRRDAVSIDSVGPIHLQGPVVASGAGLGWLAVPIPFLGAIGLLAMVFVMGRRSVVTFVLYSTLAAAALICTVTPFMVGQPESSMFNFNPLGLLHTPFPGFEALMIIPLEELLTEYLAMTLVLGLILSAGVPWLLTALFLRSSHSKDGASASSASSKLP